MKKRLLLTQNSIKSSTQVAKFGTMDATNVMLQMMPHLEHVPLMFAFSKQDNTVQSDCHQLNQLCQSHTNSKRKIFSSAAFGTTAATIAKCCTARFTAVKENNAPRLQLHIAKRNCLRQSWSSKNLWSSMTEKRSMGWSTAQLGLMDAILVGLNEVRFWSVRENSVKHCKPQDALHRYRLKNHWMVVKNGMMVARHVMLSMEFQLKHVPLKLLTVMWIQDWNHTAQRWPLLSKLQLAEYKVKPKITWRIALFGLMDATSAKSMLTES